MILNLSDPRTTEAARRCLESQEDIDVMWGHDCGLDVVERFEEVAGVWRPCRLHDTVFAQKLEAFSNEQRRILGYPIKEY